MKKLRYSVYVFILFLSSCYINKKDEASDYLKSNIQEIEEYISKNNIQTKKTNSGLYYTVTKENPSGKALELGERVTLHLTGKLLSGTVFDSTSRFLERPDDLLINVGYLSEDLPFFPVQSRLLVPGLNEGLKLLKVGEKATFIMPNNIGFGSLASSVVPPYSPIIYEVEILGTKTEKMLIDTYIQEKGLSMDETDSGIYHQKLSPGTLTGELPDDKDIVTINYTGKLLDGFQFDSATNFKYTIDDNGSFVKGWKEVLKLLPNGYKGQFILPYALAYGSQGKTNSSGIYDIPPYAPLVFEVEITAVEKKD